MNLQKLSFLVIVLFAAFCSVAQSSKVNIVFLLADDYGYGETSCNGADNYKTPNIDKLAEQGVRYTHMYTAALCGPSRAMILTGRYAFRTGATNQDATGKFTPQMETMIPKVLKQAGYVTASIGKWGQLPLTPADFGFDHYLTYQGSGIYWNTQEKGKQYYVDGQTLPLKDGEYMPDLMHADVVKFLAENKNKTFFLYYPLDHVHAPILPTPDSKPGSNLYNDNVVYMDKLVGKFMKVLDSLKLTKNTVVFFMGDNGTANGHTTEATIGGRRIVGGKGSMLEGGGLVPFISWWKGVSPKGKVCTDMMDASDIYPTIMDIAGVKSTDNKNVIDGQSIVPEMKGKPANHRTWAYNQLAAMWYVREMNWKLNQAGELYDMTKAPFEEILVPADSKDPEAITARARLQKVLDTLNPAGGIQDTGDGSGRHAAKEMNKEKKGKKKDSDAEPNN